MDKIETVVWDLGGVLVDWNPRYLFEKVFSSDEEIDYFLENVCTGAWNVEQDRGRRFEDAIALKVKEFPDYADKIPLFYSRWTEMISGPINETVDILQEMYDRRKVRLYALTNWSDQTFPYAWENFPFLRLFEGILVSGKEKLIKPDPEIYELLFRRYDINPEQAIFIDDSIKNVESANKLGLHGIQFESAAKLFSDLRSYHVL